MKYKYSILIGLSSLILGFIPISFNHNQNITYTIYSSNIVEASVAKEELIEFYKDYCYSSLFINIDNKIKSNINKLALDVTYENHNFNIYTSGNKIKMIGYLYQSSPSSIEYKYYFKSLTYSIPLPISINVATSTELEYSW